MSGYSGYSKSNTNETMETALCGCKIRRTPEGQFYVDWCSMHTAAPDLLEVCRAIPSLANDQGRRNLPLVAGLARAAINKATR
jgi:hypothetical protein